MNTITNLLELYGQHQAEINFLAVSLAVLFLAGGFIAFRIRGRRIREALEEWTQLFDDLNKRVISLSRDLMEVRQQLLDAKAEAHEARIKYDRSVQEIERLEARVKELEELLREKDRTIEQLKG